VDPRAVEQLATADRFRALARALASAPGAALVTPPPRDWALVVAFYAAVQYLGAYLWEKQRVEFRSHQTREQAMRTVGALRAAEVAYVRLRRLSESTRYLHRYRPTPVVVQDALDTDLEAVRRAVRTALGLPL
jgi:hypothetical protein